MVEVRRRVGSHEARLVLLSALAAGWLAVVIGSLIDSVVTVAAGALVSGTASAVLAKVALESSTVVSAQATLLRRHSRDESKLTKRQADLERENHRLRAELAAVADEVGAARRSGDAQTRRIARLESSVESAHETATMAIAETRTLVDKLATRLPPSDSLVKRLQLLSHPAVPDPVLSIAIPSFNRPRMLESCLAALESEIGSRDDNIIEVCITDDASTDPDTIDIAASFCERVHFGSLRQHSANVGLDRNLLAACEQCRGEFVLILGNDDIVMTGAIQTIVENLRASCEPVHLYEKTRVTLDGTIRPAIDGSSPIEIEVGEERRFPTMIDAASRQGYLSTFGFISQVVFRREAFAQVDPTPYLDLTMYPQVFVLVEAFAAQPVHYHNRAIVFHRTPTPPQKRAEALGRREQVFMSGGDARQSRYFGTTLAASWQRLIDRGVIEYSSVANTVERLMTPLPLVDWMTANRAMDPALDQRLDGDVVRDADRFFDMVLAIVESRDAQDGQHRIETVASQTNSPSL